MYEYAVECPLCLLIEADWHIYASVNLAIIDADDGFSPNRRQDIIWTDAWILSIGPLGTKFSDFWIEIQQFSLKKMHVKCRLQK